MCQPTKLGVLDSSNNIDKKTEAKKKSYMFCIGIIWIIAMI